MKSVMKAVRVSDHVYWVGAVDWNIRDFHGYTTKRGSTYNAYLVLAERPTLVDTVKAPFKEEMLARISSVMDPRDISVIVSNHTEMDHTGALPEVIRHIDPAAVYASPTGVKALGEHFSLDREIIAVKDGETINLGNMEMVCWETRMLHWPDSMFSYLPKDKILFSQDAFGMHLAASARFDDEIDPAILDYEAATYYANILLPYSPQVLKLLDRVGTLGVEFRVVAPDHGPVWRSNIGGIIESYARWAAQEPTKKAVVLYATMWHSTELMARAISEGLADKGITVKLMSLDAVHRSDVAYELLDAGILALGSPTLNNNLFPSMADVLTYLKGLRPRNLLGAAFGSYGWSGESVKQLETYLEDMKADLPGEGIRVKHVPGEGALKQCYDLGVLLAERLSERLQIPKKEV